MSSPTRSSQKELHPLDAGLMELGLPISNLPFPPKGWVLLRERWGTGYAAVSDSNVRIIIDCSQKSDDKWWVHISVSRAKTIPTHLDMVRVKRDFLGDRYAYVVYPPEENYVNLNKNCLHLWALVDEKKGQILPEFSDFIDGVKSI